VEDYYPGTLGTFMGEKFIGPGEQLQFNRRHWAHSKEQTQLMHVSSPNRPVQHHRQYHRQHFCSY
jgi:hypothetical protein